MVHDKLRKEFEGENYVWGNAPLVVPAESDKIKIARLPKDRYLKRLRAELENLQGMVDVMESGQPHCFSLFCTKRDLVRSNISISFPVEKAVVFIEHRIEEINRRIKLLALEHE